MLDYIKYIPYKDMYLPKIGSMRRKKDIEILFIGLKMI